MTTPVGGRERPADREPALSRIVLCADDYGMAPGVNRAICDLIARGRLNATSVMVGAPSFAAADARALAAAADRAFIGLHFTLTAPFRPASGGYRPTGRDGAFFGLARTFATGWLRGLDPASLAREARSQFAAFRSAFGKPPDFVDGHQHVQVVPQVADALIAVMKECAPSAWLRQCGRVSPAQRWRDPKGFLLDLMSRRLAAESTRHGIKTNPAFAGTYDFHRDRRYDVLFNSFLDGLPDGGVVMCHPGHVDAELKRLDDFLAMREEEYAFFAGERFPQFLASCGFALARP
jgi:predicted glycoside hydrolase/deacetylase ChbG (UPF0249 family)